MIDQKTTEASLLNYMTSMKPIPSVQLPTTQIPIEIPSSTTVLPTQNIENMINENLLSKINNLPIY